MNAKQRRVWGRAVRRAMDGWFNGLDDDEIRLAPRLRASSTFWDEVSRCQCAGDEMGHYDVHIDDEEIEDPCWECGGDGCVDCAYCNASGFECDECSDGTVRCTACVVVSRG